jgi:hypothetical protein
VFTSIVLIIIISYVGVGLMITINQASLSGQGKIVYIKKDLVHEKLYQMAIN